MATGTVQSILCLSTKKLQPTCVQVEIYFVHRMMQRFKITVLYRFNIFGSVLSPCRQVIPLPPIVAKLEHAVFHSKKQYILAPNIYTTLFIIVIILKL